MIRSVRQEHPIRAEAVEDHACQTIGAAQRHTLVGAPVHAEGFLREDREIEGAERLHTFPGAVCEGDSEHLVHAVVLDPVRVAVIGDQIVVLVIPCHRPGAQMIQSAVFLRHQPLRDHRPQRHGQLDADLRLLLRREGVDHPVHRLGRADRMQGGEHQVTRLRRRDGRADRLQVAHFAQHDDVRRLAQRPAQGAREGRRVARHLALAYNGFLVGMQEFDGVFHRHDVPAARAVDPVHQAGERRALAAARGTRHEDEAAARVRQADDALRDAEIGRVRQAEGHHAQRRGQRAALMVDVAPEPAEIGHREGEVVVPVFLQDGLLPPGQAVGGGDQLHRVGRLHPPVRQGRKIPLDLGGHRRAGHDEDVRTAQCKGLLQQLNQFHSSSSVSTASR